jgi:hypothetical protein
MNTDQRDKLLRAALSFTENLKGKARDRAIFDYLCGACQALYVTGLLQHDTPAWLYVIAVRGGTRVKEVQLLLDPPQK